ncbi:MAG: T9SS type A sorting domain-containing protein [Chitinophagaceae bacterium]|nr:MAG: T9SS type A sorting domain-containing protein [Chitinophagaceae bacterium]
MWRTRTSIALVVLLLCAFHPAAFAQDKYSKVRIPVKDPAARSFVLDNLEVDHLQTNGEALEIVVDQDELARLRRSGFAHTVLVDDVVQYTTELNRRIGAGSGDDAARANFQYTCGKASTIFNVPASFGTGGSLRLGAATGYGYFTYNEMVAKMQALVSTYSNIASLQTIGTSEQGKTIYGIKISDNVAQDESEPEVLYTGLQHAREAIGGTSLVFFMQWLCENYAGDAKVQELVKNREIFIIPCVNPDGYSYNYSGASASYPTTGGGLWRKNRRLISGTTYGVDLNRNYSVDWGNCAGASTSCGSTTTSQDTYYGPNAFSEKETQAVRAFVQSHHFVAAIDQHCTGPYFSLPFGRPSLHTMSTLDSYFYSAVPALMGFYNCHLAGNSPQTVNYEVAGGIKDWLLMGDIGTGTKGKIYGMTGEAGGGSFWAPINQIKQLCQENTFQNLQLAYAAGAYYSIEDQSDIVAARTSGKFAYELRNIGLSNGTATVSLVPIENIASVGAAKPHAFTTYYQTATDSISYTLADGMKNGYRIRYAWKITAPDGLTMYDTVVKIYNPLTLLSDDMEGSFSTNWTTTSDVNTTAGKWGFVTTAAYGGTKSMTESPSGNYTTSTTRTVTYRNTFNLSDAAKAYLSFWVKHRSENCRDKLQVQFSTNGTTWTPYCGTHTVSESNGSLAGQPALTGIRDQWTREIFDMTALLGQSTVYMRFQFTSDNDADGFAYELDDGFYIDNVKVVKTTQTFNVLPVHFLRFTGKLQENGTVRLDWEAYTDAEHSHFEVERSADGQHYESLGRSVPQPPYLFTDAAPFVGSNYYRIRQVDRNGRITFSNVVLINVARQLELRVFPNPVADKLQVRLSSGQGGTVHLALSNLQGSPVWSGVQALSATERLIEVPLTGRAAGTYLLRVSDTNGNILATQRVVKL